MFHPLLRTLLQITAFVDRAARREGLLLGRFPPVTTVRNRPAAGHESTAYSRPDHLLTACAARHTGRSSPSPMRPRRSNLGIIGGATSTTSMPIRLIPRRPAESPRPDVLIVHRRPASRARKCRVRGSRYRRVRQDGRQRAPG